MVNWGMCHGICTDRAAPMTGKVKGLVTMVKNQNPPHCIAVNIAHENKGDFPESSQK